MKNWERRLIKDFQMVPSTELSDEDQMQTGLQLRNEDTISKWRRVLKMVAHDPSEHQWAQVNCIYTFKRVWLRFHFQFGLLLGAGRGKKFADR